MQWLSQWGQVESSSIQRKQKKRKKKENQNDGTLSTLTSIARGGGDDVKVVSRRFEGALGSFPMWTCVSSRAEKLSCGRVREGRRGIASR